MNNNRKLASHLDAEPKNVQLNMEHENNVSSASVSVSDMDTKIIGEVTSKRTINTKVYEREDHSLIARRYFGAVHFKDTDGDYKEIDRTLVLEKDTEKVTSERFYVNRNGETIFRFAETMTGRTASQAEKTGRKLRWSLEGAADVKGEPAGKNAVVYPGLLPDTDLVCQVGDLKVKENLVLRSQKAPSSFRYLYQTEGLVPVQEDGRIVVYEDVRSEDGLSTKREPVFTITAPCMTDAKGNLSEGLKLTLENEAETRDFRIILTADQKWLSDPSRAYPVTIDPVTSTSLGVTDIYDTYIDTNAPGTQYHTGTRLYTKGGTRLRRSLLYFPLPELSSGDMVTAANLVLVSSSTDNASKTIEAHRILTKWDWPWTSGTSNTWTTWNNSPLYEEAPLDICTYTTNTAKYVSLDITRAIKQATADSPWYGILLKGDYELSGTAEFLSSDHEFGDSDLRPHIDIAYLNCSGLEDYWTYHSQEVGRAGTVHVNDYTGNLILVHDTASLGGSRLPLALSHVYNSNDRKKDTGYGYGWRLSYQQTLEGPLTIGSTQYYRHTDVDGTVHYFSKVDNVWKDETEPETTLTVNSSGTDRFIIKDHENNQLVFDANKRLIKVKDKNANQTTITYNSDGKISSITDGAARTVALTYTSGHLTKVATPLGNKTFTYSGNHLVKITDVDGKQSSYTYNTSGHYLTIVSDWSGYTVVYRYYTNDTVRVKDIREYRNSGIQPADKGNSLTLTYGYNTTKFVDGDERAEIYRFNNQGNVVSIHDGKGHAASAKYGTTGNHVNRLLNATMLQETVVQLLENPMIEAPASGSTVPNWTGVVNSSASGSTSLNSTEANCKAGSHSLKIVSTAASGEIYWYQSVHGIKGRTYTVSACVKAEITNEVNGGVRVRARYKNAAGTYVYKSSPLHKTTTEGFIRLAYTFDLPSDAQEDIITVMLSVTSAEATAYWDMIQLEEGSVPNRVNLVSNGSFYTGGAGGFTRSAMEIEDAVTTLNTNNSVSFRLPMAITASSVSVYNKPDTSGTVLETLSKGALVCGLYYEPGQTSGTWIKVRTSSGKTGYITSTQAFTYAPGSEIWNSGRSALTSGTLYSSTSTSSSVVASSIAQGTALCIKGTSTVSGVKWAYVGLTIGGVPKFGYMQDKHVIHLAMNEPSVRTTQATHYLSGPTSTSSQGAAVAANTTVEYQGTVTQDDGVVLLAAWNGNKYRYLLKSVTTDVTAASFTRKHQEKVAETTGASDVYIYKVVGDTTKNKKLSKTIALAGKIGDCYMAGGWGRGTSLPESSNDTSRRFGIAVTFTHTDNTTDTQRIAFTPDIIDWQYACGAVVAKKAYSSIKVEFEYCRQAGQAYFDGLSLFREEFGQSYTYDDKDRVTTSVDAAKKSSTFSYNANSDLQGITDPLGNNFTYTYDNKHNVTQGKSAENVKYCMTYDSHGNITRSGAASSGDAANGTWVDRSMCALGHHAASVKDTDGNQTSYVWEEQTDRLAYIGDPNGNIRSFSYDTAGRLVNTSQHADVDGVEQEIQNSYTYGTGSDRLARITHNGFDYVFTYDGFGNLTRVQTAASGTSHDLASYTYGTANSHLNGSLQKITYGDGSEISYVYDDLDRVVETKYKAAGSSSAATLGTFTYNGQGDLYCTSIPNGRSYYMEYDLLGRLMHVRDSDGCTFQYTYDANNRMKRLEHWNGARRGLMSYSYDGDGRETLVSMGGLDRESAYDSCGRLTSRIWNEGGTALADNVSSRYRYTSTESGTRLGTLPTALETGGGEFQYTYDGNGNITQIKRIDVLTTGTVTDKFHYDAANQLVREDSKSQDKTFQYLYDAGGNLKAIRQYAYTTGTLPSTPSVTVTATYSTGVWKDQLTNWNGKVITYDANGCMTQKGTGTTYSWGANRRLASVSNGNTVSYSYDLSGARIRKTVNGTLTEYRWGGSLLLSEKTGSDTICYYYDTAGILTGMALNGTLYLYIRNLQGDVIGIANRFGTVVVQYAYDSWGNITGITGSMATTVGAKNPFRYRGYYYDVETGMYYLGSRYYDPEIRRFISADSYIFAGSCASETNIHLYCKNNPVNLVDYSGNNTTTILDILVNFVNDAKSIYSMGVSSAGDIANSMAASDGPYPIMDVIAIGVITVAGIYQYNIEKKKEKSYASSYSIDKRKEIIPIYRYGRTSPGNLTPKKKDEYSGLSFSTIPPSNGKAAVTTMEALNATNIVHAIQDKPTHVAVYPLRGTMKDWIDIGPSSIWTRAVLSVVVKWDGGN